MAGCWRSYLGALITRAHKTARLKTYSLWGDCSSSKKCGILARPLKIHNSIRGDDLHQCALPMPPSEGKTNFFHESWQHRSNKYGKTDILNQTIQTCGKIACVTKPLTATAPGQGDTVQWHMLVRIHTERAQCFGALKHGATRLLSAKMDRTITQRQRQRYHKVVNDDHYAAQVSQEWSVF